ncbi:MAG: class I SAM-dependent methyltransferase [Burkholderiaceae bacterium]|nr:class I SAM-dependent methyltransferase [Burkholderiaceae bacterium]MCD8517328.1 class I SAM-dependent methyltransferase [Burkholderiaceae bacterium]MCD8537629.1 class I SAM-dependent methyltransferase [Burkholderiaceae bacterium]MCD8566027.1 class I SAM-dependent methyltransferase [Burkholderiaceae bacterium]
MGEFSAQWLSLREPVDHAARNVQVREAMLADLRKRHGVQLSGLRVLDLGCGSGSNLRALAPLLGEAQHWTLVDYDRALLAAARQALTQWADQVMSEQTDSMRMMRGGIQIDVDFRVADLSGELDSLLSLPVDLVSASALFDLVSSRWVDGFCDVLRAPLYAVLSFDGQMQWEPRHKLDQAVTKAFCAHQVTDKGFGAALGPTSGQYLRNALEQRGFTVTIDKSPWEIEDLPSVFHDMLIDGVAKAVAEIGHLGLTDIDAWLASRRDARRCVIGHDDLYAASP